MTRRHLLGSALLLLSCSQPTKSLAEVLPTQFGSWSRRRIRPISPDRYPPLIAGLGVSKAASADYEGEGRIQLQIYEMKVETSAFELIQKWQQRDGLAIYKGPYFVVAKSRESDPKVVAGFLREFKLKL
ncbi:MAG: hypothetical protein WKF37_13110 [Bryobacteraceae bacterium]